MSDYLLSFLKWKPQQDNERKNTFIRRIVHVLDMFALTGIHDDVYQYRSYVYSALEDRLLKKMDTDIHSNVLNAKLVLEAISRNLMWPSSIYLSEDSAEAIFCESEVAEFGVLNFVSDISIMYEIDYSVQDLSKTILSGG
ncbi:MAG: hypothetical protein R3C12_21205 [Planctomycetaceae bacterium]|nr:hypothetical protein [Planctomycetaceae bacterium]